MITPDRSASYVDLLRSHGMRSTPQRRLIIDALAEIHGHVTASEIIERCRQQDPDITPSTVYRTLDALEGLGIVQHSHGADGREEYHIDPGPQHGHLECRRCGAKVELTESSAGPMVRDLRRTTGFLVDLSHVTIVGVCRDCLNG